MWNEARQRLTEFCQENTVIIANTLFQQHKRRHGHHQMVNTEIRLIIQSTKTRPGADCSSDHKLLIAKFRLKLKKIGETPRPFRYDLNQIPYNYTVEVRNRFKDQELIDRVPDELWTEVRDIAGDRDQDHPHGKEMQ